MRQQDADIAAREQREADAARLSVARASNVRATADVRRGKVLPVPEAPLSLSVVPGAGADGAGEDWRRAEKRQKRWNYYWGYYKSSIGKIRDNIVRMTYITGDSGIRTRRRKPLSMFEKIARGR